MHKKLVRVNLPKILAHVNNPWLDCDFYIKPPALSVFVTNKRTYYTTRSVSRL